MNLIPAFLRRSEERASLENPTTEITASALDDAFFGGATNSESGITITGESALRLGTVFACVRIISQTIATMPREVIETDRDGKSQKVTGTPGVFALTIEPNEYMSAHDFFVMMQTHAEIWGNSYAAIERNGAGQPANLLPLISRNVSPRKIGGKLVYDVAMMDGGEGLRLPSTEIIHFRGGVILDGLVGLSPILQAKEVFGLSIAAEKYGARFFKNDARPSVVLKHEKTLSEGAASRLKSAWLSRYGGTQQHAPAVLEEGLDVTTIGVAPNEAQFLETRKYQRQEIAALFGVPLAMLADPEAKSYANNENDTLRFVKLSILPRVASIEAELNRKLFPKGSKKRVRFDFTELERGSFKDQVDALAKGIQSAIFTPNEARGRLGLEPIEGGDELFLQQNMAGAKAIADGTAGNAVGNATDGDDQNKESETDEEESSNDKEE
jgi:HK97 family phage portal protein